MADLNGFNASDFPTQRADGPVPQGEYRATIIESGMKPTRSVQGQYLELSFEIAEGEFQGRRLWARLNLDHPNDTAVRIARQDLAAICRAVGVLTPKDSTELHGRPLIMKVKAIRRADTGEMTSEVRGFAAVRSAPPPTPRPAAATPQTPTPHGATAPSPRWRR